ncbi:unnamed protein product [Peniophora sp. CBMAI 1063]|nr:unnamed protein product [Peniophora sp. CBMAI 1063]
MILLLVGLRVHWREAREHRLWNDLWNQGLLYLLAAALIDIPVVVLVILDVDPIATALSLQLLIIIMPVCTTRMFRFLNKAVRGENEETDRFTGKPLPNRSQDPGAGRAMELAPM